MSLAVGNMWVIEESPAASVEDVKEKEQLYERLRENLTRRYARLADLATATRFGVEVDPSLWKPLADYATEQNIATLPQFQRWLDAAQEIAAGQRFFHWELEFPEVFFDRHGKPLGDEAGFDAVVGNPSYVRQEALGPVKPYFKDAYPETYHGVADLYVYFYQQGLRQLRRGGRISYIVTNKWLRAGYGEPLRGYFAEEDALVEIVDFGHAPIFPDADVFPCIVALQKRGADERDGASDGEVRVAAVPREELGGMDLGRTVEAHAHTVPRERFGKEAWSLESSAVDDLMAKIRRNGVPLAEFAGVKPAYGIKTGLLLWAYMWRNATHGKDETLRLIYSFTETLPIAPPTDEARAEAEEAVGRLVEITRAEPEVRRDALDWLHIEYGVLKPGQKLSDFATLDGDAFVEEVRKRRPKGSGRLSPAGLKELRAGYADLAPPVREGRTERAAGESPLKARQRSIRPHA